MQSFIRIRCKLLKILGPKLAKFTKKCIGHILLANMRCPLAYILFVKIGKFEIRYFHEYATDSYMKLCLITKFGMIN